MEACRLSVEALEIFERVEERFVGITTVPQLLKNQSYNHTVTLILIFMKTTAVKAGVNG